MTIEIKNVSKTFGGHKALDNVSLRVDDGKLVSLLGPSGSGKTTLLRIIAGLETFDDDGRGAVLFHEQDVSDRRVEERQVGFVFQHYALFKHMTVFENVAFGLRVRPAKLRPSNAEIADRVSQLLKMIQLDNFGARYPAQLSGGQRQRVALARALAIEPRVMLLDEPFGALDAKVRQDLRRRLRDLQAKLKMTTILVTHDQEEALEVSDEVVVMNQARIEQIGTPEDVFHRPANEFVIDFLGNVNVFHGRMEQGQAIIRGVAESTKGTTAASDATKVYVRPHELEIERTARDTNALPATIARINPAGALTRIALVGSDGREFQVELPFERFVELGLRPGDSVFVAPRKARVFTPDYVI